MITGALDAFTLTENSATISGWAYKTEGGERLPIVVGVTGTRPVKIETFRRPDIGTAHTFGIRVVLKSPFDLLALVVGSAQCVAEHAGENRIIPIWKRLKSQILSAFMIRSAQTLNAEDRAELLGALLAPVRSPPGVAQTETTTLSLEVGFRSYDNAVVVGRDGHLFLEAGTNKVSRMYDEPATEAKVAGWTGVIDRRRQTIGDAGAIYLQVIVPEKQSVLDHLHPSGRIGCTPLLDQINDQISNYPNYVDTLSIFSDLLNHRGLNPYRKIDTHLSVHGCQALVEALSTQIVGRTIELETPPLVARSVTGDLGNKIGFGNVVEQCLYPAEEDWVLAKRNVRLDHASDPARGHIGSLRRWTCDDAAIDRRVLIFGNSMFERGGKPLTLSWWFARLFREVCFVWSPEVDLRLVREMSPDVVVCQTVERFLRNVPTH